MSVSQASRKPVYRVRDEAYSPDANSASYWHLNTPNTFVAHSWLLDDMLRDHNERFFYLTAQNLKICNDVWVGMVQFRLGQSDAWVYMGMTTVICDAAAKVRRAPLGGFSSFSSWVQVGSLLASFVTNHVVHSKPLFTRPMREACLCMGASFVTNHVFHLKPQFTNTHTHAHAL
jgi:hypothetical protein